MDAEEKKSSYNTASRKSQNRTTVFGLHNFPDISAEDSNSMRRGLPSEENFQRIQYANIDSNRAELSSGPDGEGSGYTKGSLSTAQLNEQAYRKGFAEGKINGMIEAESAWQDLAEKKLEPLLKSLQEALLQLKNIREATYRQIEKELVQLSLTIAKQIICREITIDREIVLGVTKEALAKVEDPGRIKIKMSSSDLKFVKENLSKLANLIDDMDSVTLEAAEGVPSGGCIIETEMGEIDARIEKQLQAVEESFRTMLNKT